MRKGDVERLVQRVPLEDAKQLRIVGTSASDDVRVALQELSGTALESIVIDVVAGADALQLQSVEDNFAGSIELLGGDGDDIIDASLVTTPINVDGGSGNDQITGGVAADHLTGKDGNDT